MTIDEMIERLESQYRVLYHPYSPEPPKLHCARVVAKLRELEAKVKAADALNNALTKYLESPSISTNWLHAFQEAYERAK